MGTKQSSQRRYPPELRERAVRMVLEGIAAQNGQRFGVVTQVAKQLGVGPVAAPMGAAGGGRRRPTAGDVVG